MSARFASAISCGSASALHHGGVSLGRDVELGRGHQAVDQGAIAALAVQDGRFRSFMPLPRRAGAAMPACSGALMPGHAFSIEDALVASRWAEQILSRGYRVVITPRYKDAEEIIEVYIPSAKTPVFRVHRTLHSVLITDCIGLTLSFSTLADALLAMAPLSKSGRREMLKGPSPAWLPTFTACSTEKAGRMWPRVGKAVASAALLLAGWHRG